MTRRLQPLLFALPLLASGCSGRPEDNLIAVILGSVLVVLLLGTCGCSLYTGMLGAGAINLHLNLKKPTARSKKWGFVYGVMNVLNGIGGVVLVVLLATKPNVEGEPAGADVYLMLIGGTLVALGIGAVGLWATIRATPGRAPRALDDELDALDDE